MAELTTDARPYAKAAFAYAKEQDQLAAWSDMLAWVAAVLNDANLSQWLENPTLTAQERFEAIKNIAGERLDDAGLRFIQQLSEAGRLPAMNAIAEGFEQRKAEHEASMEVHVRSAFDVSESEANELRAALKKTLNRSVTLVTQVDDSLIGGVVVQAGDLVIDGSISGKLKKLAVALNG